MKPTLIEIAPSRLKEFFTCIEKHDTEIKLKEVNPKGELVVHATCKNKFVLMELLALMLPRKCKPVKIPRINQP